MDLIPVQICRTLDGWSPVQVASASVEGSNHTVLVNPYVRPDEFVCDCKGFEFRGHCRHQEESLNFVCWWPQISSDLEQTPFQKRNKICPQCGGPCRWEMVDAEA